MTTGDETIATLTVALAGAREEARAYKRERDYFVAHHHAATKNAALAERAACAALAESMGADEVAVAIRARYG